MRGLLALVVGAFAVAAVKGDELLAWPQFRGPGGSGVAEGPKPPVEFGPDRNVQWKVPVPGGLSSPIVVGDKVVLTAFEGGKLYTIAYRRADGREAWRAEAPAKAIEAYYKPMGNPAASTPATDGERIVSYFGSCGLFYYDLSGKERWKVELPPAVTAGDSGSGVSPILVDGTVILLRDQVKDSRILALDAATGAIRWEKKRRSPVSYSTPVVWDGPAGKQVVAAGHLEMIGYDLKTGAEKWSVSGLPAGCCTSPMVADGVLFFAGHSSGGSGDKDFQLPSFDELLKQLDADGDGFISREEAAKSWLKKYFDKTDTNRDGKIDRAEWEAIYRFASGGKSSAFALKYGGSGDATATHLLWKQTRGVPYIASPIVYRGQLLMVTDGGIVTAYDARTGNEVYHERAVAAGKYFASPVAANGHVYFTSQEGAVTVLRAGSDRPEVVARNPRLGEQVAASPAIADGVLYIRTERTLYAFAEKK